MESTFIRIEGMQHISTVVDAANDKIHKVREGIEKPLITRWRKVNDKIQGLYYGDQVVIAARTGVGKSAFVNLLLKDLFLLNPGQKLIGLYWSFEMPNYQQVIRWYSNAKELAVKDILSSSNRISDEMFQELKQTGEVLKDLPIYFRDIPVNEDHWYQMILQIQAQFPDHYIINIVDHTRLIKPNAEFSEEERISKLMYKGVELKNKIGSVNIFLTQMNRNIETGNKSRDQMGRTPPVVSDIFGADSVGQCATLIIALHRPELYGVGNYLGVDTRNLMACHILKQRDGWTGLITLDHNLAHNSIQDRLIDESETN
jgi:replicative DNA helicase